MSISSRFLLSQGAALRASGRTAMGSLLRIEKPPPEVLPTPWIEERLPPRSDELVRAYVRHVGGDPSLYRGTIPPHFVSQWGFDPVGRALSQAGYPLTRVINAGFRLESHAPFAAGETIFLKARLESVDDDGRRARLVARMITGTRHTPEALVTEWRAYVPLSKSPSPGAGPAHPTNGSPSGNGSKKQPPSVPVSAREVAYFRLKRNAGLDFVKLTGDINPIHWVPAIARAAGFRSCILHGFSTFSRAYEALVRNVFSGDIHAIRSIDVRFTRPLVLPGAVGVYVAGSNGGGGDVYVGDAVGSEAYLEGHFEASNRLKDGVKP